MSAEYSYPWLLNRRRFVIDQLEKIEPQLRDRYLGALLVLRDEANPDRIALAAHGLREVSGELMKVQGVQRSNFNLGKEITDLLNPWEEVQKDAATCTGVCANHVGQRLRKFLDRLKTVLADHERFNPTRLNRIGLASQRLDVNSHPASDLEARQRQWKKIHEFFTKCAHHSVRNLDELNANLDAFESLLITLWLPSPSLDLSAIDEILAEENTNA